MGKDEESAPASAEEFIRSYVTKMQVEGVKRSSKVKGLARKKKTNYRMRDRNFEAELLIWFPTKRPALEVIKDLHPEILHVWLPRQNTARFCYLEFANEYKAREARKEVHRMTYQGSKGRGVRAMLRKRSSSESQADSDQRLSCTNEDQVVVHTLKSGTNLDDRDSPVQEDVKTPQVITLTGKSSAKKRKSQQKSDSVEVAWSTEPGSLLRIKPQQSRESPISLISKKWKISESTKSPKTVTPVGFKGSKKQKHKKDSDELEENQTLHSPMKNLLRIKAGKKLKSLKRLGSLTPKSEPGSILRIKPKPKLSRLKAPRISL